MKRRTFRARVFRRLLLAVMFALTGAGCASTGGTGAGSPEIAVDRKADGSTITLRPGQRLAVSLPGNPTTGFVWELLPGSAPVLEEASKPEYTRGGGALGAGGVFRFTFRAAAAGRVPLKLVYRRPFEGNLPPANTFEMTVEVRP